MTFLSILGVTEICSFRLVLKEKIGKEIPEPSRLEFLESFLANNFALIRCRSQHLQAVDREEVYQI